MPQFHIRSKLSDKFCVRLANCTREHAESVLAALKDSPSAPDDPHIVEVENLYDEQPHQSFFARLRKRGK